MVAASYRHPDVSSHSRTIAALLAVATLGLLYFATWGAYDTYIARGDELSVIAATRDEKRATLDAIEKVRATLSSSGVRAEVARYAGAFREDEILDSLFAGASDIRIGNIAIAQGSRLPNGLSLASVSVSIEASDIPALNRYLDYLTGTSGTKRYVVQSLSFPYQPDMQGRFGAGLSLGMYYFQ